MALTASTSKAESLRINEIQSFAGSQVADEDGDYPDWIELYNPGPNPLSLADWSLSDRTDDTARWVFPSLAIEPREFLLVFASGKDRRMRAPHHESILRRGDNMRYFVPSGPMSADWMTSRFDDSNWAEGPSGFGYGDSDDATIVPATPSLFVRARFDLANLEDVLYALLHVDYDDGFVAYLNGREIARSNLGLPGTPPAWDQLADLDHEANLYRGLPPERFVIPNIHALLSPSRNVLAVEVHNSTAESSDLTIIPFLTLGLSRPMAGGRGAAAEIGELLLPLHADFRIAAGGETLSVYDAAGRVVDRLLPVVLGEGLSFGRQPDGTDGLRYFAVPTPGSANSEPGYAGICSRATFSEPAGFKAAPTRLSISAAAGEQVLWTRDGRTPSASDTLSATAIPIDTTTVIRAVTIRPGWLPGPMLTRTYFIGEANRLPVVSIITDPGSLWDPDSGIYVLGRNYDPVPPHRGANYWQDWERLAHVEFYETDGRLAFDLNAGIKIHGGWTRFFPQKSLDIIARQRYGTDRMRHQVFPGLDIDQFKALVLRNSGSDWNRALMRDAMMIALHEDIRCDVQAYRPALVFLNGAYWGILDLREKLNEHYLASHHAVDPDSVDRMEVWGGAVQGTPDHYRAMLNYIETNDVADSAHYAYIETQMETGSFIDFNAANIYVDNTDWPGNNNKFWRPQSETGRWRWFLFDLDFGFGLHDSTSYRHNTLAMALEPNGPEWPNPPIATFLFRKLMENITFRAAFINRLADLMNFDYRPERASAVIDSIRAGIAADIPRHLLRWAPEFEGYPDPADWEANVAYLKRFARERPAYVREHVVAQFGLLGTAALTFDIVPDGAGTIVINTKTLPASGWQGTYFRGVPLPLSAIPAPGWRFAGWSGLTQNAAPRIAFDPPSGGHLIARFTPLASGTSAIVINEINFRGPDTLSAGDWVELYVQSGQWDLTGWTLRDDNDGHIWRFPSGLLMTEGEYWVIAEDSLRLVTRAPQVNPAIVLSGLSFGLGSDSDQVRLYDAQGRLVDSVAYRTVSPWPVEAAAGTTLELIDPALPNELPHNWRISPALYGSPGRDHFYHPPRTFALLGPPDRSVVAEDTVRLVWQRAVDPDPGDMVRYRIEWSLAPDFALRDSIVISDTTLHLDRLPGSPAGSGLPDDVRIWWRVTAYDERGLATTSSAGTAGWQFLRRKAAIPGQFTFQPPYPNPFNQVLILPFDLPTAGEVQMAVYDLAGREIWSGRRVLAAGRHRIPLAFNDLNKGLSSGVYVVLLESGVERRLRKVVLLK